MKDKEKGWWVVQVIKGVYNAYGPYSTLEGARNRFDKTSGGEVFLHDSWYKEPEEVVDEFKASWLAGVVGGR